MPISEDEWTKGESVNTWESATHGFLEDNHPKAYSAMELVDELYGFDEDSDEILRVVFFVLVTSQLDSLRQKELVEAREISRTEGDSDSDFSSIYFRAMK